MYLRSAAASAWYLGMKGINLDLRKNMTEMQAPQESQVDLMM
jgi:hypothetical protein